MTVLERVPLEEISAQARQIRFGRTVLAVVAWLLIGFGRLAGYAWLVPVWCFLAIRTGWRDVHPPVTRMNDGRAGTR